MELSQTTLTQTTLADRFRAALDACDQAYVRGDATPVAQAPLPPPSLAHGVAAVSFQPPLVPTGLAQPPAAAASLGQPVAKPSSSVFHTLAVVAGVVLLAIGAWFIRQKLVIPMLYGKSKDPAPASDVFDPQLSPTSQRQASTLRPILRRASSAVQPSQLTPGPKRRVRLVEPAPSKPVPPQKLAAARAAAARLADAPPLAAPPAEAESFFDEDDPNFTML